MSASLLCASEISLAQQQRWKDISELVTIEMESFSQHNCRDGSILAQSLAELNRSNVDYSSFLRRFAMRTEVLRSSQDEFDYNYYTLGLNLYKDTPFIEPLEYREDNRIHELVIAIDTSGSVCGDLVQAFLQRTYDIIMQESSFAHKFEVHIIQCDKEVLSDTVITCRDDFSEYLKTMQLLGFRGTDFRPVFEHVSQLRKEGHLKRLKGLLYFTDGKGIYPVHKPDYDTAFVFLENNETINARVPAWAIKVLLDPIEFEAPTPLSRRKRS